MARLVNPIWVTWDDDDRTWVVGYPWFRSVEGYGVAIPIGYETDLASIPRVVWWIPGFSPYELGLDAPIVHDWLYQHGAFTYERDDGNTVRVDISRRQVDHIFLTLMKESHIGPFRRNIAWLAVRCFGWLAWHRTKPTREPETT